MPAVILILLAGMLGVHAIGWLSETARIWTLAAGAVVPAPVEQPLGRAAPYLLHVYLHGGLMHLAFNSFALLSFGTAAARPFGPDLRGQLLFLAFFALCSAAGAAAAVITAPGSMIPMIGASTGLSGCIAAAGWAMGGRAGMMQLALPWGAINLVLAVIDFAAPMPIAWAGHLGGLVAGAALYPLMLGLFARPPR